ncbi:hypothetical protein [Okeania sp. SIO2C2]|uniref:hypothetical protein n=1 Tax=Okeania sp. SIO2C2 TaxID=2607787 RepID=UPI00257D1012|nr:hypothetical protein [Okeania sp. SIO2C2]
MSCCLRTALYIKTVELMSVDASVMAIAERLEITKFLTLERRDFQLFRPKHCQFFEIMP